MAKRFTDTYKWDDEWFLELEPAFKLLWLYMLDNCDHAGVWKVNFKKASFCIGALIDRTTATRALSLRITEISVDKWFIHKFINFQYGVPLKRKNNAHRGVLKLLHSHDLPTSPYLAPNEELVTKPYDSLGDKDKDKDKDKDTSSSSFLNKKISLDKVIQLFNDTLANKPGSKIGFCHGLSGDQMREFVTTCSHKKFQELSTWEEIFQKVSVSDFLKGNKQGSSFVATLNWLVQHTNALNVLNGQFGSDENKPELPPNRPQKSFKSKTNGVVATPQNPTGNPYIQEALEKGLL